MGSRICIIISAVVFASVLPSLNAGLLGDWTFGTYQPTKDRLTGICYAQGFFWAGGSEGSIVKSVDGKVWMVTRQPDAGRYFGDIFYTGDTFFIVGLFSSPSLISRDGITWTEFRVDIPYELSALVFGDEHFEAAGRYLSLATGFSHPAIWESENGTNWTRRVYAQGYFNPHGRTVPLTFGNGRFLAGDFTKASHTDWLPRATPDRDNSIPLSDYYAFAFGNGIFFAQGLSGQPVQRAISTNGLVWTKQAPVKGMENGFVSIIFNDGLFVGIADDGLDQSIAISRHGVVWALGDTGTGQALRKIAYANGTYVALTSDGTILQAGRVTEVGITTESLFAANTNRAGIFRVTRTGGTESDLAVDLSIEGSAINGKDYEMINSSLRIPAGKSSMTIQIVPRHVLQQLETTAVILRVKPGDTFITNEKSSATVLVGNGPRFRTEQFGPRTNGAVRLLLEAIEGSSLVIEWSADLKNWQVLQTITSSPSMLETFDGSARGASARFYRARLVGPGGT